MGRCERVAVVGVDFTEMGDDAILEALVQLGSGALQSACFVYVIDPRELSDDPEWRSIESEQELRMRVPRALARRIADIAAMAGLEVGAERTRVSVRVGRTVPTLLRTCLEHDADLLILGTHARLGLDRRVLGPIADALVRRAPCPVLIARPKSALGVSDALPVPGASDAAAA